jgi:hypothetical protein
MKHSLKCPLCNSLCVVFDASSYYDSDTMVSHETNIRCVSGTCGINKKYNANIETAIKNWNQLKYKNNYENTPNPDNSKRVIFNVMREQ